MDDLKEKGGYWKLVLVLEEAMDLSQDRLTTEWMSPATLAAWFLYSRRTVWYKTTILILFNLIFVFKKIMPWLRRLVVGLLQRKAGFRPRPIHVRNVADEVALEQVLLRVLRLPLITTIPVMLHTPVHYNTISTEGQENEARESNKAMFSQT